MGALSNISSLLFFFLVLGAPLLLTQAAPVQVSTFTDLTCLNAQELMHDSYRMKPVSLSLMAYSARTASKLVLGR